MLIFGSPTLVNYWYNNDNDKCVLNFTSLLNCKYSIAALNPYTIYSEIPYEDYQFDIWYKNFIELNANPFRCLISLMRLLYNGIDVYILIDPTLVVGSELVESLIKYIYEMYGYVSNIVNDIEDFENLKEGTFSLQGVELFDNQMEYYEKQYGSDGLQFSEGPYQIYSFNDRPSQPRGGLNEFI